MSDRRILLALTATFVLGGLGGCTIVPYRYVELTSDNVAVTEVGRPPNGGVIGGRRDIPIRYALEEPGVSLSLAMTPGHLSLRIESSAPIAAVSIEPGHVTDMSAFGFVIRESAFEYTVNWRLVDSVGERVEIEIALEDRADPILISGVIAESGKIIYGIGI